MFLSSVGLEDQLLGRVILTEKKELESERTNLIKGVTENKRKMLELEQNLLYKLTTIQGSLLDDETLIGVLNVSKDTAMDVREKLAIAKETEIKINSAREEFRYDNVHVDLFTALVRRICFAIFLNYYY